MCVCLVYFWSYWWYNNNNSFYNNLFYNNLFYNNSFYYNSFYNNSFYNNSFYNNSFYNNSFYNNSFYNNLGESFNKFSLYSSKVPFQLLAHYSFFEPLDCSTTNCHCPGLSLDHTAWIYSQDRNQLTKYLTTLSENKSGDTASNNPSDTARKRPLPDLAGWQHTMGWRPPSPEIGDRRRFSTNWLPSATDLISPPPNKPN